MLGPVKYYISGLHLEVKWFTKLVKLAYKAGELVYKIGKTRPPGKTKPTRKHPFYTVYVNKQA